MCDNSPFKPKPFKKNTILYSSKNRTDDLKSRKIYHDIVVTANNVTDCGKNYNGTIVFDESGNIKQFRNYELAMNTAKGAAIISKGCDCEDEEYLESYTPTGSGNSSLAGINRSLRPMYNAPTGEIGSLCCEEPYTWKHIIFKVTTQWQSIGMSSDGTVIFGGANNNMWRSLNSGVDWDKKLPNTPWGKNGIALSRDGTKVAANSGVTGALSSVLYYSLDSTNTSFNTVTMNGGPWQGMCSSNDNQRVFVASSHSSTIGNGGARYSLNYGQTWNYSSGLHPQADWYSIGCNGTGSIVYIGQRTDDPLSGHGELWRSVNSGANFSQITAATGLPVTSAQKWYSVDMSDDAIIVYAVDFNVSGAGGFIWMSKDAGTTFSSIASAGQRKWTNIKCSSNGEHIIASTQTNVFTSDDFGTTWKQEVFPAPSGGNWRGLDITPDGKIKIAASYGAIGPPFPALPTGQLFIYNNLNASYY